MFFFSSRRRHTRFSRDWSSDVCSSDLARGRVILVAIPSHNRGKCLASVAIGLVVWKRVVLRQTEQSAIGESVAQHVVSGHSTCALSKKIRTLCFTTSKTYNSTPESLRRSPDLLHCCCSSSVDLTESSRPQCSISCRRSPRRNLIPTSTTC